MNKKVAISQSNYIPWKGYFDLINSVDEFILYDDMQYTRRDWRNRNKIKTPNGPQWLTIPVEVKGKYYQKINETKISDANWHKKHLLSLKQNYSKSNCFKEIFPFVEKIYLESVKLKFLSEVNAKFINEICQFLKINTKITFSSEYEIIGSNPTENLINVCKQSKAKEYFTGPAAKAYIDESCFFKENIDLIYFDYTNYREYKQLFQGFSHNVTILDMLFNLGENTVSYLKTNK